MSYIKIRMGFVGLDWHRRLGYGRLGKVRLG